MLALKYHHHVFWKKAICLSAITIFRSDPIFRMCRTVVYTISNISQILIYWVTLQRQDSNRHFWKYMAMSSRSKKFLEISGYKTWVSKNQFDIQPNCFVMFRFVSTSLSLNNKSILQRLWNQKNLSKTIDGAIFMLFWPP